jgi:hypothetical protein
MSIYTHCIAQQDGVKPASDVFSSALLAYSLMFWRVTSAQIRSPRGGPIRSGSNSGLSLLPIERDGNGDAAPG